MILRHISAMMTFGLLIMGCSYPKRHSLEKRRHTTPFAYLISDNGLTRLVIARAQSDALFIVPEVDSFAWLPNESIVGHHNETGRSILIDRDNTIRELKNSDFEIIDYDRNAQALLLRQNAQLNSTDFFYGVIERDQVRILRRFGGQSFPSGSSIQDAYTCGKGLVCLYINPADSDRSVFALLDSKSLLLKKLKIPESVEGDKSTFIKGYITFFSVEEGSLTLKSFDASGVSAGKPLRIQRPFKTDMQNAMALDVNADGTAILVEFMQGDKSTGLYYFDYSRNELKPVTGSSGLGHFEHSPKFHKP